MKNKAGLIEKIFMTLHLYNNGEKENFAKKIFDIIFLLRSDSLVSLVLLFSQHTVTLKNTQTGKNTPTHTDPSQVPKKITGCF